MSREDLVAVASRLFAVFLLVTIARSFPSAAALLSQEGHRPSLALVAIVLIAGVAICAVLWFFPLTIARKLLPVMKEPRSETSMSSSAALSVGLTLLGVWVLAYAIPDAIYWMTRFLLIHRIDDAHYAWGPEQIASVATTVAEIALAAWLIFGSSGIRRLIYKCRYGVSRDAA
ncbi:hypothetical protein [Luteimonas sp. R10]|uniref:hypothetical protein n=1 Tax=Luteimonas sp. R10 TaxID=3108176 RepID=UPI00308A37FA|nr:hypothetical protein U3649_02300 [Luteimonas sp. R10]